MINQIQEESMQNSIPQHQTNCIYWCECGKKYLSFPALYLHAKTKHRVKFTSKLSPDVCKIIEVNGVKEITYYIKNSQNQDPTKLSSPGDRELRLLTCNERSRSSKPSSTDTSEQVTTELFKQFYSKFPQKQKRALYQNFQSYLEAQYKGTWNGETKKKFIYSIPWFLNPFALQQALKLQEESEQNLEWKKICQDLFIFSNWLKQNKHTDLVVECDII